MSSSSPLNAIARCKDGLVLVLTPLLLSPLLIWHYQSTVAVEEELENRANFVIKLFLFFQELRCLFVVLLMAVYWMLAPIPLPVTALIPVVAFPLLGLASTEKVLIRSEKLLFYHHHLFLPPLGLRAVPGGNQHALPRFASGGYCHGEQRLPQANCPAGTPPAGRQSAHPLCRFHVHHRLPRRVDHQHGRHGDDTAHCRCGHSGGDAHHIAHL